MVVENDPLILQAPLGLMVVEDLVEGLGVNVALEVGVTHAE